jgi:hypothetical protein
MTNDRLPSAVTEGILRPVQGPTGPTWPTPSQHGTLHRIVEVASRLISSMAPWPCGLPEFEILDALTRFGPLTEPFITRLLDASCSDISAALDRLERGQMIFRIRSDTTVVVEVTDQGLAGRDWGFTSSLIWSSI